MADLEKFRARVPIVGRMIEKVFNGDKEEGEIEIDFILIASKRDGNNRVTATLANVSDPEEILRRLIQALTETKGPFEDIDEDVAGHA